MASTVLNRLAHLKPRARSSAEPCGPGSVLYLCYASITEPLTETQVMAYLDGLCAAGYTVLLLTFEPRRPSKAQARQRRMVLAKRGIQWYWLPYHKRPTLPATLWDVATGAAIAFILTRTHRVRLLHARAHVPGVMALIVKVLLRPKLLFDVRGFMAEEYVDAGTWAPNGRLFRLTKRMERLLVRRADGIVVLTHRAQSLLEGWYPDELRGTCVDVIPCCVDLRSAAAPPRPRDRGSRVCEPTIAYVGKLGGWYLTDEMADFMAVACELIPRLHWYVWTQSDFALLQPGIERHGLNGRVSFGCVEPAALTEKLNEVDAGFSFVKPCLSKRASSPTKIGEYLAAGLPVISTAGIGDVDTLLLGESNGARGSVGVLVSEFTREAYVEAVEGIVRLLNDPETASRCRAVAESTLSLQGVGWPRYRAMYRTLLGG